MKLLKQTIVGLTAAFILSTSAFAGLVNINKADALTIQNNLKGVGKVKAEAIVKYRKKHGDFKKVEDIVKVKGIGPKLLKQNLKDLSLKQGAVKTVVPVKQDAKSGIEKTEKTAIAPEVAKSNKEISK